MEVKKESFDVQTMFIQDFWTEARNCDDLLKHSQTLCADADLLQLQMQSSSLNAGRQGLNLIFENLRSRCFVPNNIQIAYVDIDGQCEKELSRLQRLINDLKPDDLKSIKSGTSIASSRKSVLSKRAKSLKAKYETSKLEDKLLRMEEEEKLRQAKFEFEIKSKRRELESSRLRIDLEETQAELEKIDNNSERDEFDSASGIFMQPTIEKRPVKDPRNDMVSAVEALTESMSLSRLPAPEPSTFEGDPMAYPIWKTSFNLLIESRNIKAEERIYYLSKYVKGDAKALVEGTFYLTSEEAYQRSMALLEKRYGNQFEISEAFRKKLNDFPKISSNDSKMLTKFSDLLQQTNIAMSAIKSLEILNDIHQNKILISKLPHFITNRWARKVANYNCGFPPFSYFADFVEEEAKIARHPVNLRNTNNEVKRPNLQHGRTFLSTGGTVDRSCSFCQEKNHEIVSCKKFKMKTQEQRKEFLLKGGHCFGCLRKGHRSKDCKRRLLCEKCQHKHPTVLHGDYEALNKKPEEKKPPVEKFEEAFSNAAATSTDATSMIIPVYISTLENPDEHMTYAMLDTQSDTTFILRSTAEKLNTSAVETKLKLSTMTSTTTVACEKYSNLLIRGITSTTKIRLPPTFSRDFIPAVRSHIPTAKTAAKWNHLRSLKAEIPHEQSCEVGLLIGYNCPEALAPVNFISGTPFALKTVLGWGIVGGAPHPNNTMDQDNIGISHRIVTKTSSNTNDETKFIYHNKVKEELSDVIKTLESDFPERKYETKIMSQDDITFMKILERETTIDEDGHYEMPLPFRNEEPDLPNNKDVAIKRLEGLKKRFGKDEKFYNDYKNFMTNIIENDAEEVQEQNCNEKTKWFIPHHGVYHSKKGKIRVVFDCSAKFMGTSLNSHLLQGPDLMNSLTGVLLRFRRNAVAVTCDIEKMFHQFKVQPRHRKYLSFLWWRDGDINKEVKTYRMKVHLFGATSSPGCANYGLKKLASDNKTRYESCVSQFLINDFYVDDGLTSVETEETAIKLIHETRSLCANGGLRLHKFTTNSQKVFESIPPSERAEGSVIRNLENENDSIERVLGIQWCIRNDTLMFKISVNDKAFTRRGLLSTVASIYDPLGIIAPFTLIGKQILHDMCKERACDWDSPLSENLKPRWERWLRELPNLEEVTLPRCYSPPNFGKVVSQQLHHFSDASFDGYGQCSYLRLMNDNNDVHCCLLMGKARVTPKKVVTIPRLELTAALLSVKISNIIRAELNMDQEIEEYFWTDSKIILGYINNDARRFHVFVANRVQQIRESTKVEQWRHVATEKNPADYSSRGLYPRELLNSTWFTGPTFLWEETIRADDMSHIEIANEDPEIKRVIVHAVNNKGLKDLESRFEKFSTWKSLTRAFALLKQLNRKKRDAMKIDKLEEQRRSELFLIKESQQNGFSDEIYSLLNKIPLKRASKLYDLDPFLDENEMLRVGGRLKRASSISYDVKHPLILPKTAHVTKLLVNHCHDAVQHQGRGFTMNEIRSRGYYIIGMTRVVASHIYRCVTCRKLRAAPTTQKMADLPEDRVEPSPPFSHCGLDCFGPFYVKDLRKEIKRYGLIVTCMASRAIHIEILDDMSTDSFINALRCVIALRGSIRTIRCDRGTNFVGAANELKKECEQISEETVSQYLNNYGCDFQFNYPYSSHMGGVWERQIRTIRSILSTMLHKFSGRLDTSSLKTIFYEVASLVNSRPLAVADSKDVEALTPNHLLMMKSKVLLPPPGEFTEPDAYARKRWKRVQVLVNQFWDRWRKEYLINLNRRSKWNDSKRDIVEGDVVIIHEQNQTRSHWPLGKVIESIRSKDNLVRKVKVQLGDSELYGKGKIVERPIHKLTVLLESQN